jgi:hypothetical protein
MRLHTLSSRALGSWAVTLALVATAPPALVPASAGEGTEGGDRLHPLFSTPAEFKDDLGRFRPVLTLDDGSPVRTAEDWGRRRREILAAWHERLGPWPPPVAKPEIETFEKDRVETFTRHRARVTIAPDRTAPAYLLVPDGPGPFPAVLDVFYYPEDGAGLKLEKRLQNDFGYQLAKRGFVALCVGLQPGKEGSPIYYPGWENAQLQPLSYLAYVSSTCHAALARVPGVDPRRIGIVGHSYGGKWALFAGALSEAFAAVCVSDPGIVFDEARANVNYWEPWYLGYEAGRASRKAGIPSPENPRAGPYKRLVEEGRDLHELIALIAPRPFFVAGGSEDSPGQWRALNHAVAVNRILGVDGRVGMSNRPEHKITPEANEQIRLFFEHVLRPGGPASK